MEFKEHKRENISTSTLTSAVSGSSKLSTYSNLRNVHSQAGSSLRVGVALPNVQRCRCNWTINILGGEQVTLQQNSPDTVLGNSLKSSLCLVGSTGCQRGGERAFLQGSPHCAPGSPAFHDIRGYMWSELLHLLLMDPPPSKAWV